MKKDKKEKRKYQRYDTEVEIYFQVAYDIKMRVKFQVFDTNRQKRALTKYSGVTKDISAEGLCLVSKKKLEKGDILVLEVYVPNVKVPTQMRGEVRWSQKLPQEPEYRAGVKIVSVNGKLVAGSIRYDTKHEIVWSIVLEAVFENFKAMIKRERPKSA